MLTSFPGQGIGSKDFLVPEKLTRTDPYSMSLQQADIVVAGVLGTPVGVMHQFRTRRVPEQGHSQCAQREFIFQCSVQRPTHTRRE